MKAGRPPWCCGWRRQPGPGAATPPFLAHVPPPTPGAPAARSWGGGSPASPGPPHGAGGFSGRSRGGGWGWEVWWGWAGAWAAADGATQRSRRWDDHRRPCSPLTPSSPRQSPSFLRWHSSALRGRGAEGGCRRSQRRAALRVWRAGGRCAMLRLGQAAHLSLPPGAGCFKAAHLLALGPTPVTQAVRTPLHCGAAPRRSEPGRTVRMRGSIGRAWPGGRRAPQGCRSGPLGGRGREGAGGGRAGGGAKGYA
jgi:hypothetical protein